MTRARRAAALGLALAAVGLGAPDASAHGDHVEPEIDLAPPPLYEPPAPGSYELPVIDRVETHEVLDEDGRPVRVPALAAGQVAVVSFVYTHCGGTCPLALAILQTLDRALARDETLSSHVSLVTVSFDPARDTPERMAELRRQMEPRGEWRFVTAADSRALTPLLADYGQGVVRLVDVEGAETGLLRHVLKVFLVDDQLRIRNVYSTGLMDPRLLLNDIQTILAD